MNKHWNFRDVLVFMGVLALGINAGPSFYSFVEEPVNSSIMGMGSAGTSIGKGGFNFYNPAGLSIAEKSFVAFDFTRIFNDLGRAYFESGWVFSNWFVGAAFQTQQDQFQRTDEKGILPDAYGNDRGTLASITTGIKKERYALGISFNAVQEIIAEYQSYGFSGSAGMIVTIIPQHIYAGLSAIHAAGRHTTFMDNVEKLKSERFPATVRGGISWQDTLMQRFPVVLSADVVYRYNDRLLTVPIGVDFNLLPPISIRIGKRLNHPTELFSMGVGLQWKNIAFNAAFAPVQFVDDLLIKRSVGLVYTLATPGSSTEKKVTNQKNEQIKLSPIVVPVMEVPDSSLKNSGDKVLEKDSLEKSIVDTLVSNTESDALQAGGIVDSAVIDSVEDGSELIDVPEGDSTSIESSGLDSSGISGNTPETAPLYTGSVNGSTSPEKLPATEKRDDVPGIIPVPVVKTVQFR